MNEELVLKMAAPSIKNGTLTYALFDRIYSMLSLREQYQVCEILHMFDIARNYHVQMICLSEIGKSDILSCFDLVIRAVVIKISLSSKEQLTHEGNETIEHGFYRSEQLKLTTKS